MLNHFFQWLSMGGYGYYVWPSYIITCTMIALQIWHARRHYHSVVRDILNAD